MKKKIITIILLLCCIGCTDVNSTNDKVMNNIELSNKVYNETMYGHKNKDKKEAMSVDEALDLIENIGYGVWYDKIEYYNIVKLKPGEVENDYYAFLATLNGDNYYILVDIYNGATTMVNEEYINNLN